MFKCTELRKHFLKLLCFSSLNFTLCLTHTWQLHAVVCILQDVHKLPTPTCITALLNEVAAQSSLTCEVCCCCQNETSHVIEILYYHNINARWSNLHS